LVLAEAQEMDAFMVLFGLCRKNPSSPCGSASRLSSYDELPTVRYTGA
jgi:hypothetical protein